VSLHGSTHDVTTAVESQHFPPYRGFRFEEERALMAMMSGVTVPNAQGNALPVNVTFRDPARELSPAPQGDAPPGPNRLTYPYFLLEFLDMTPRRNEEVRGIVPFHYEANTANAVAEHLHGYFPLPVMLHYQCSVYSRVQQHDVILNDICATTFFPIRFGQLTCPSGTVRRLDYESGPVNRDSIAANNQRTYCKVWNIAISAEFVTPQWVETPAKGVSITVATLPDGVVDQTIDLPSGN
jgi:hypothetical protein